MPALDRWRRRVTSWTPVFLAYFSTQTVVQLLGIAAGLILVNVLPVREFALYTLAMSAVTFFAFLSDLGSTSSLMHFFRQAAREGDDFQPFFTAVLISPANGLSGWCRRRAACVSTLRCRQTVRGSRDRTNQRRNSDGCLVSDQRHAVRAAPETVRPLWSVLPRRNGGRWSPVGTGMRHGRDVRFSTLGLRSWPGPRQRHWYLSWLDPTQCPLRKSCTPSVTTGAACCGTFCPLCQARCTFLFKAL